MKEIFATIPEDMQLAAQTLGVDENTAKGLIQLYKSLDKVDEAQKKVQADTKNLNQVYMQSMGALEAFTASLNKFKSSLSEQVSTATNWLTDALKKGFSSSLSDLTKGLLPEGIQKKVEEAEKSLPDVIGKNFGSTAIVAGTALTSAMLFGGGLQNLIKGKAAGVMEKKAAEETFGMKATPVYVVNTGEIATAIGGVSGAGAVPGATGPGFLSSSLAVAGAGVSGYYGGGMLNEVLKSATPDQTVLYSINQGIDKMTDYLGRLVSLGKPSTTVNVNGKEVKNNTFNTNQVGLNPSQNKPTGTNTP
jgi:hypothetical protein